MGYERETITASMQSEDTQFPVGAEALLFTQLASVLSSEFFRESLTTRRLLEYIVTRSVDGKPDELKEFTIGVEVLGRKPDFDPKLDTIVRVHIHRLRQKLADYYSLDGRQDPVRISIPRGSYRAEFSFQGRVPAEQSRRQREPAEMVESSQEHHGESSDAARETPQTDSSKALSGHGKRFPFTGPALSGHMKQWSWPVASLVLVCAGVVAGYHLGRDYGTAQARRDDGPVAQLWRQMLAGDANPIIGYANDVKLFDETNDKFSFSGGPVGPRGSVVDPHIALQFTRNRELVARAGPLYYDSGNTGTGDLEGVAMLVGLLHDIGIKPEVKRMNEISSEDFREHNVIMLGSAAVDKTRDDLPSPGDFQIAVLNPGTWVLSVANHHPLPGEQHFYSVGRSPDTKSIFESYAIISYQPGIASGRHILILGGTDTTGTAGAASFLSSPVGAQSILNQIAAHASGNNQHPFFQAIVHCTIKNGDSVSSTKAVAVHTMPWRAE